VLGAYLLVSGLHALWDSSSTAGIVVTVLTNGTELQKDQLVEGDLPAPSTLEPPWLYGTVQWGVMIAVAIAGVFLVRRRWRRSLRSGDAT
jgi:hypothetical protein